MSFRGSDAWISKWTTRLAMVGLLCVWGRPVWPSSRFRTRSRASVQGRFRHRGAEGGIVDADHPDDPVARGRRALRARGCGHRPREDRAGAAGLRVLRRRLRRPGHGAERPTLMWDAIAGSAKPATVSFS